MGSHYNKIIWKRSTVRMETSQDEAVKQFAKRSKRSAAAIVREAVKEYLGRKGIK